MSTSHFGIEEHMIPCSYIREYPGALLDSQEDTLQLHIKQYTPLDGSHRQPGAITIIGAHANAFPKELYEALWDDLYEALKKRGQAIAGIWISDVAHQGASGLLNEDKLGNDPSWYDHPRDMFLMINHFREKMPRPLVGIGHSMGGNHLVNMSYYHPRLLSSLVLIDPVIHDPGSSAPGDDRASSSGTQKSTFRRDKWPSRAEARTTFLKSKFYRAWDARVLDLLVKYALRKLPTVLYPKGPDDSASSKDLEADNGPVTLTTTKHQEVFTFLRPKFVGVDAKGNKMPNRWTHPDLDLDLDAGRQYRFYRAEPTRTFHNLQYLRPSAMYIFGGQSLLSPPDWRKARMERTGTGVGGSGGAKEGKVKEKVFEDVGHLLPMEIPKECAEAAADFLSKDLELWRKDEAVWKKAWESRSRTERSTISEEWKRNIGGVTRAKPLQKL